MVVDAVDPEPVSSGSFPAIRENNSEFTHQTRETHQLRRQNAAITPYRIEFPVMGTGIHLHFNREYRRPSSENCGRPPA
jgi:hypothetical protein